MNLEQEVLLAQGDYRQVILILQTAVIMHHRWDGLMVRAQAPVVRRLDNAIHRINRYPVDKC